jgi:hypothetical protein
LLPLLDPGLPPPPTFPSPTPPGLEPPLGLEPPEPPELPGLEPPPGLEPSLLSLLLLPGLVLLLLLLPGLEPSPPLLVSSTLFPPLPKSNAPARSPVHVREEMGHLFWVLYLFGMQTGQDRQSHYVELCVMEMLCVPKINENIGQLILGILVKTKMKEFGN